MFLCVRGVDFAIFYDFFRMDFGTVPTVLYFLFIHILEILFQHCLIVHTLFFLRGAIVEVIIYSLSENSYAV